MKRFLSTMLVALSLLILMSFTESSNGHSQTTSCKCITDALSEIEKIKVGMKRKDFDETFSIDGGISRTNPQRFVYQKCNFIKVEAKFKFIDKTGKFPKHNSEDEIIEISKPYLEHPFAD
jgi:hypothetical protein